MRRGRSTTTTSPRDCGRRSLFSVSECSISTLRGRSRCSTACSFWPSGGAFAALEHSQALARPSLERIYHLTAAEADRYFRDLWLVVHSLATLIVTGGCPYTDREIGQTLTGFSLSICKSIKEVPGFAAGTFDQDAAFRALLGEKE